MSTRTIRLVSLFVVCVLVGASCSKPKNANDVSAGATTSTEVTAPLTTDTTAPPVTTAAAAAAAAAAAKTPAAKKTGSALGGGDDAQARAVGAAIRPQSTTRGTKPYYQGVSDDAITLDFSTDPRNCGVAVVNAVTAAGGTLPTATRFYRNAPTTTDESTAQINESINIMVKYWNDHAFDAAAYAPEIRKLMGNDPAHQFFGRKLVGNIIDGGSNQCPDQTRSGAIKAAQVDKAFVVFNNLEGASPAGAYNMAANLNAQGAGNGACTTGTRGCTRPMHFGSLWLSDQEYSKFAPFAWTQFATGSTITRQSASYVCSRLVGKNAVYSPDAVTAKKPRVFGLVHTNLEQDKRLADEYKGYLQQYCGKNIIAKEVEYDGKDFAAAQRDGSNLISQLNVAGVTSVLMLTEPIGPLFQLAAAKGQNYFPEWVWSSYGYSDSSTVQRLYDQSETAGSIGTSNLGIYGGFGFGAGDPFKMYHAYHLTAPDGKPCDPSSDAGMDHGDADKSQGTNAKYCKSPGALVTWYYSMLPFIGGLLFAGPDATPQNVTNGLQAFPTTRYGGNGPTSDPRPALVGAGKGKFGFIVDALEWRWRPDYKSPKPESKDHWVEYPDCQRHYILWGDQLAPNWEKTGPNYNAFCGVKKDPYGTAVDDYPRTLPEDSNP